MPYENDTCSLPHELRRAANYGDGDYVELKKVGIGRGREAGDVPQLRRRLKDASLLSDGITPGCTESETGCLRRAEFHHRRYLRNLEDSEIRTSNRRSFLKSLVAAGVIAPSAVKALGWLGVAGNPANPGLLPFAPPVLTSPTTYFPTNASPQPSLGTGDAIISFPATAMSNFFRMLGHYTANNVISIGGADNPIALFDPTTMYLLSDPGTYAISWRQGFTGATGGTFTIGNNIAGIVTYTAPLDYNCSSTDIYNAIAAILPNGSAAIAAVSGSGTGGPWYFVPQYPYGDMSPPTFNLTGLTGSPVLTVGAKATNTSNIGGEYQNWNGALHVEGQYWGGPNGLDGMDISTYQSGASMSLQNMHYQAGVEWWNNNWLHLDGCQPFSGPDIWHAYLCDFITYYGNGLIAQPRAQNINNGGVIQNLEALHNWYFRSCLFQSRHDAPTARLGDAAASEEAWPSAEVTGANYYAQANWFWDCAGCYANVINNQTGLNDTSTSAPSVFNRFVVNSAEWPSTPTAQVIYAGITTRVQVPLNGGIFCDPAQNQCGINYISPGYQFPTGTALPAVLQCLNGETMLQSSYAGTVTTFS